MGMTGAFTPSELMMSLPDVVAVIAGADVGGSVVFGGS